MQPNLYQISRFLINLNLTRFPIVRRPQIQRFFQFLFNQNFNIFPVFMQPELYQTACCYANQILSDSPQLNPVLRDTVQLTSFSRYFDTNRSQRTNTTTLGPQVYTQTALILEILWRPVINFHYPGPGRNLGMFKFKMKTKNT